MSVHLNGVVSYGHTYLVGGVSCRQVFYEHEAPEDEIARPDQNCSRTFCQPDPPYFPFPSRVYPDYSTLHFKFCDIYKALRPCNSSWDIVARLYRVQTSTTTLRLIPMALKAKDDSKAGPSTTEIESPDVCSLCLELLRRVHEVHSIKIWADDRMFDYKTAFDGARRLQTLSSCPRFSLVCVGG
jgi:hypothetical protein